MFEVITIITFIWLLVNAIGMVFRLTWCTAKIVASLLIGLALPMLIFCFLFAGGAILLIPVIMIAVAAGILKICL